MRTIELRHSAKNPVSDPGNVAGIQRTDIASAVASIRGHRLDRYHLMVTVPTIPASLCPAISHSIGMFSPV